jgi:hypothetical protein
MSIPHALKTWSLIKHGKGFIYLAVIKLARLSLQVTHQNDVDLILYKTEIIPMPQNHTPRTQETELGLRLRKSQ